MGYYLAVDAGGTSTRAVVLRADGHALGCGVAGSGNPVSSGTDQAAQAVVAAARGALDSAGLRPTDITSGVAGMAGASVFGSGEWLRKELVRAGISDRFDIRSDLLATFCSGSFAPHGYALVAGTGAVAVRVRGGEVDAVADGLGWLLGDAGSGYWIGQQVARHVSAALDGRGPATTLTRLLLDDVGIAATTERDADGRPAALRKLVEALYRLRPIDLARFAPLAFAAPDDPLAQRIVAEATDALAATLTAVVAPHVIGPLVLGGSVLSRQRAIADRMAAVLRSAGVPPVLRHVPDGLAGAAVLALRLGAVDVDEEVFERIAATLDTIRAVPAA